MDNSREYLFPSFLDDQRISFAAKGVLIVLYENLENFGCERKETVDKLQIHTSSPREETEQILNELINNGYILVKTCPENGTTLDTHQKDSGNEIVDNNN